MPALTSPLVPEFRRFRSSLQGDRSLPPGNFSRIRNNPPVAAVARCDTIRPFRVMESEGMPRPARRRQLLNWLLGLCGGSVFGSVLYPVARYLTPPDVPEASDVTVSAGSARTLAPNSGRVVAFGSRPALVIRTAAGELRAFSATCTHLDCTVQYRPDLRRIWCACHNGQYDVNGRNVAGPPPRPLEAFDVNVRDDEIVISRRS
jgi:Rieske Fe-S protein